MGRAGKRKRARARPVPPRPIDATPPAYPPWLAPAVVTLAGLVPLLLFWPTTGFGFLLDDFVLFQNSASLRDLGSITKGFELDVGGLRKDAGVVQGSYYRPVFLALSTIYYQLVGGEPRAWHVAAVVLGAAVGALAAGLFLRLGWHPVLALLGAIVFSLHPAHVSSIAWASGLQELLAASFVLTSVHGLLWRPGGDDRWPLVFAAATYLLGLLSKEMAIGLLPLVAAWGWLGRDQGGGEARRFRRAAVLLAVITVVYLGIRLDVLGGLARPWPRAPGLGASLPAIPIAIVAYLEMLVWPTGFSIFRPERPEWELLDPPVLISLAVLAALGAAAYLAIRRKRELLLPLCWLAVWLLPVLNIWALPPQWMVTDRYLFLSCLALPWLIVVLVPRRFAIAVLALLAATYAVLSLRYAAIFRDERTFLVAMEKAEPTSAFIKGLRVQQLLREGQKGAAIETLRQAVELDPGDAAMLRALGEFEVQRGDLDAAERHFRQVAALEPTDSRPFRTLWLAFARRGEWERGFAVVEEAARRWPKDFQLSLLYAVLLEQRGQRLQAEAVFDRARRLRPMDPAVAGGFEAALARLAPMVVPHRRAS